jgi:hypothetical protein
MAVVHRSVPVHRMRVLVRVAFVFLAYVLLPARPAFAQDLDPQLTLTPQTVSGGDPATASGTGFPADANGQILWTDGASLGAFATDPTGAFALDVSIPPVEPGSYSVTAVVDGVDGQVIAEASVTVEAVPEPTATTVPPTEPPAPTDVPPPTDLPAPTEAPEVVEEPAAPPYYPIAGSSHSDNSPDAAVVYDGDPATYWVTDAITPVDASLTLDLGEVRAISSTRCLLATGGTLSSVDIQLSEDGVSWVSLVTLDATIMPVGSWFEQPVDVWARYVRFVADNPNGLPQLGGFAEIEVWPAPDARPLSAIVTPEPEAQDSDDEEVATEPEAQEPTEVISTESADAPPIEDAPAPTPPEVR